MAKMRFNDWLSDVRLIVRNEMRLEPSEIPQYDEEEAHEYFVDGYSPKRYVKEMLIETAGDSHDHEIDLSEI